MDDSSRKASFKKPPELWFVVHSQRSPRVWIYSRLVSLMTLPLEEGM